jgi:hypothetical protein
MTDKRWIGEGWTEDRCIDVSLRTTTKISTVLMSKVACKIERAWGRGSPYNPKFRDGISSSHQDLCVRQFSVFFLRRPHPPWWEIGRQKH